MKLELTLIWNLWRTTSVKTFQVQKKLYNFNGFFPTSIGSFQLRLALFNFRLSNFSFFPTALSNYTYPYMTHKRWVTVFPDLCELICNIIFTVFFTVHFVLRHLLNENIISWIFKDRNFLMGFKKWFSGRCSNLESRGEKSIFWNSRTLNEFWKDTLKLMTNFVNKNGFRRFSKTECCNIICFKFKKVAYWCVLSSD